MMSYSLVSPTTVVMVSLVQLGEGELNWGTLVTSRAAHLLQCGHHYRVSLAALHAVGADAYDETGVLIMTGEKRATACAPRARRSSCLTGLAAGPSRRRWQGHARQ